MVNPFDLRGGSSGQALTARRAHSLSDRVVCCGCGLRFHRAVDKRRGLADARITTYSGRLFRLLRFSLLGSCVAASNSRDRS